MARYEGRLELTWTNKHLRLLAEDDGSYTWVPPSDYRVAEIRLLHDLDVVGQLTETDRTGDNLLVRGDALHALHSLAALPEMATEYAGKAGVLNEQFIDRRTRAVLRRDAEGRMVASIETTPVSAPMLDVTSMHDGPVPPGPGNWTVVASLEDHTTQAQQLLDRLEVALAPREDAPTILVPKLRMTTVRSDFSLADITELEPFRRLGERIAADPVGQLRRVRLSARVIEGADGLRRTELVPTRALDRVESPAPVLPLDDARQQLTDRVLNASVVPARANQHTAAQPIVDAFLRGLGAQADTILSGYMDRAAAALIDGITEQQRRFAAQPSYGEVVELVPFRPTRMGRPATSSDRVSSFKRGIGYEGYQRSMYAQDWFDSSTERDVANLLDDSGDIIVWASCRQGTSRFSGPTAVSSTTLTS